VVRFLIRRTVLGAFVMIVVITVIFGLFFFGRSSDQIARSFAGGHIATPTAIADAKRRLLLNKPLYAQYLHFLNRLVLHHDLGHSYVHGQAVSHVLKEAWPVDLSLALGGGALWLVLGLLAGIVSAVKRGSVWDRLVTVAALFFYSTPVFVLGLLLLYFLYYRLSLAGAHFFPGQGYTYITHNPVDWLKGMILPWIAIALISAATYARLTRGSMLDVMGEDYVRTARAKGLSESRVIYRHVLRAALTPVTSQFGIDVGTLIGGSAVLTETVFGMPGLGYTAVHAINQQDLPVILGVVIVAAAAVVVVNIAVDAFYAVLDPRVRLH
jgi:peptide/nickel transport system permease protein